MSNPYGLNEDALAASRRELQRNKDRIFGEKSDTNETYITQPLNAPVGARQIVNDTAPITKIDPKRLTQKEAEARLAGKKTNDRPILQSIRSDGSFVNQPRGSVGIFDSLEARANAAVGYNPVKYGGADRIQPPTELTPAESNYVDIAGKRYVLDETASLGNDRFSTYTDKEFTPERMNQIHSEFEQNYQEQVDRAKKINDYYEGRITKYDRDRPTGWSNSKIAKYEKDRIDNLNKRYDKKDELNKTIASNEKIATDKNKSDQQIARDELTKEYNNKVVDKKSPFSVNSLGKAKMVESIGVDGAISSYITFDGFPGKQFTNDQASLISRIANMPKFKDANPNQLYDIYQKFLLEQNSRQAS